MGENKIGQFIAKLRKEKQMTQRELAEQLHITDKAVSKWGATVFFTYLPAPQIKAAAYLTASSVQLQTSAPTFSAKVTGALSMGTSLFCFPLFIQHLLSLSFVRDVGYYNIKCVRFQLISFIFGLCAKM